MNNTTDFINACSHLDAHVLTRAVLHGSPAARPWRWLVAVSSSNASGSLAALLQASLGIVKTKPSSVVPPGEERYGCSINNKVKLRKSFVFPTQDQKAIASCLSKALNTK